MYLRIEVPEKDRKFLRFLWRDMDPSKEADIYEFQRVVFVVNSSPYLAQYVTQQHARDCADTLPEAADTVLHSTYMDDSMDSCDTVEQAQHLYHQLTQLWNSAGMHARK